MIVYLAAMKNDCVSLLVESSITQKNLDNLINKFKPTYIFFSIKNKQPYNFKKIVNFKK